MTVKPFSFNYKSETDKYIPGQSSELYEYTFQLKIHSHSHILYYKDNVKKQGLTINRLSTKSEQHFKGVVNAREFTDSETNVLFTSGL